MRRSNGRRRGAYVPPAFLILAVLAAALALAGWFFSRGGFSGNGGDGGSAVGVRRTAGSDGCTLTELGEAAVHTGELILVNNWTPYHFPEEQPLACIFDGKTGSYYVRDKEVYLAPEALDALNEMMDAFRAQGGSKTVNVVAGYRTAAFQQHLFDQSAEKNGQAHAEKYVAQPGGSEHHTALAVDFSLFFEDGSSREYTGDGEYAWINSHCQDYGWVVRYDEAKEALTGIGDEPWHFRYVGVPHATVMAEKGLCLEEYIDYLKEFPFDGQHLTVDCGGASYEIWYCAGTAACLPESGEYTVSGNNVDGIIVTQTVDTVEKVS
ncbi:MAG: M15 family metallopeptidase [Oscillospiraceae bacterium]|nr:M15 family metallopeptidase [Oscillospiraceae bacterium]